MLPAPVIITSYPWSILLLFAVQIIRFKKTNHNPINITCHILSCCHCQHQQRFSLKNTFSVHIQSSLLFNWYHLQTRLYYLYIPISQNFWSALQFHSISSDLVQLGHHCTFEIYSPIPKQFNGYPLRALLSK